MTLIQACICAKDESIVLIGDRMVTIKMGEIEYETEAEVSKLYTFDTCGIGFAGTLDDINIVIKQIDPNKKWKSVDDFAMAISDIIKESIDKQKEDIIYRYTSQKLKDFIKDPTGDDGVVPIELKKYLYSEIADISVDAESIVIGFNEQKKPRIYMIDENGMITDKTDQYYTSIGSGLPFSEIYFDQHAYTHNCVREYGVFFAFRAKKAAEFHAGVGSKTDVIIIDKPGVVTEIESEDPRMGKLEQKYKTYREDVNNLWKKIADEIKQEGLA